MDKQINYDNDPSLMQDWSIYAHLKLTQSPKNELPLSQQPCYGFQRGNIIFTAQPPQRQDSGLGSSSRGSECDCAINVTPQCEVCCGMRSPMSARRGQSFTAHFCTKVSPKKHLQTVDNSSQTSPSTSMIFPKEHTKKIHLKNRKYELDKHKKHHARTVHIDVYCTESSDSDDASTIKSSDTLLDLSEVKINCKKIAKKKEVARSLSKMSSQRTLQRSPCLSVISSTNTISNSSFFESSSCGLSSFMDSTSAMDNSSICSEFEFTQQKCKSKNYDDSTSTSDEECSETAWSFNSINSQKNQILARRPWFTGKSSTEDMGSFSDCSQSPMFRQPTISNCETNQVAKMASKFGPMRLPKNQDHHVGPSKNPDCTCFNCRRHFNTRHRSYSIGSEADQSNTSTLFKKCL